MDIISYINKSGITLDQEDIIALKDTNINTEYKFCKYFSCKGFTLLHKLVLLTGKYPNLNNVIKKYLEIYPEEVNKVNEFGLTALHIASMNSNSWSSIETVRLLISNNANVNAKSINWITALMYASFYSNDISSIKTVKLLLENDANVNAKHNRGITTLKFASYNSNINVKVIKLLLEYDAIPTGKNFELVNDIRLLNIKN